MCRVAAFTGAVREIGRSISVEFPANKTNVTDIDIAAAVTPHQFSPHATVAELEQTGKMATARGCNLIPFTVEIRNIRTPGKRH
jgi:hypothetical protein